MLPAVRKNSTVYESMQLQQFLSNMFKSSELSYLKSAER
jgi:hypothetical protein